MDPVRVIPCLDMRDGRVVKGVKFVDIRDARDPAEAAAAYSEQGADELVMLDITATLEARETRREWVKKVAEAATVPFAVGGGIASLKDMEEIIELGAAKVSVNSAAVKNPALVEEAAKEFGSGKLVVAVDGETDKESGRYEVLISGGTKRAGLEVVEWSRRVADSGAGEILLTSKDTDGVKTGFDIPMTRAVADTVPVPVVASGGAGKLEHFSEGVTEGHAAAVLAASVFHFGELTVLEVKEHLKERGIAVNL
ncbi:MAG: imidazole glycerol phosphate synthase subunit HisF [Planctomycetota bacterium]|jgi:cyclase